MGLLACADCGTQVSTEAKSCPKCGRRRRRPVNWRWAFVAVLVAAGAWAVSVVRDYEKKSDRAAATLGGKLEDAPTTPAGLAQKRLDQVEEAWARFDKLPEKDRTPEVAHAVAARLLPLAEGVSEPGAKQIRDAIVAGAVERGAVPR